MEKTLKYHTLELLGFLKGMITLVLMLIFSTTLTAQHQDKDLNWKSISEFKVYGSLNTFEDGTIRRFPDSLQVKVRPRLWKLSENTAGFYIKIKTNAPFIKVHYRPLGELSFPHMSSTGVSGVDLYIKSKEGFNWVRGAYVISQTVRYTYSHMDLSEGTHEFWVYLPLYQSIADFKVGIPKDYIFEPIRESSNLDPVIIYGTSIAQGACASRAGMAWSNILGRQIPYPVVNMGFSGNGRLEPEVIDYISRTKASLFILDCMANFTSGQGMNPEKAKERLIASITSLKKRHPDTPILIVQHAGYGDGTIQKHRYKTYSELNSITQRVFSELKPTYDDLFLLTKDQIGLTSDSFVDGTHPNDHGMIQYANAYKEAIDKIFR